MGMKYLYWSDKDLSKMSKVEDFSEVADISISVIKKIPKPVMGISFPLTSGGYGIETNKKIIGETIYLLTSFGFNVFNLLPLEMGIGPLKEEWQKSNSGYCMPILETTYRKIFETRLLEMFFISPEWYTSEGSIWENETLFNLGIHTIEFPLGWYERILLNLQVIKKAA